jgi:hypothetical protein
MSISPNSEELSEKFATSALASLTTLDRIFTHHTSPDEAAEIACSAIEMIADAVVLPNDTSLRDNLRLLTEQTKNLVQYLFADSGLDGGGASVEYIHMYEALDESRKKLDSELARYLRQPANASAQAELQKSALEVVANLRDDADVVASVAEADFVTIATRFEEEFRHMLTRKRTLEMRAPLTKATEVAQLGKQHLSVNRTRFGGLFPHGGFQRTSRMTRDKPDVFAQAADKLRVQAACPAHTHPIAKTVQSSVKLEEGASTAVSTQQAAEYALKQFYEAIGSLRGGRIGQAWYRIKDVLTRLFNSESSKRNLFVITMRSRLLQQRADDLMLLGGTDDTLVDLMLQHIADDKDSYENDWFERHDVITPNVIDRWPEFVALKAQYDSARVGDKQSKLVTLKAKYVEFVAACNASLYDTYRASNIEVSPNFHDSLQALRVLRQSPDVPTKKKNKGKIRHAPVKLVHNNSATVIEEPTKLPALAAELFDSGVAHNSNSSIAVNLDALVPLFVPASTPGVVNTTLNEVTTVFTDPEDDLEPGITDMTTGETIPLISYSLPEETLAIIDKATEWKNGYANDLPPDIVSAYFSSSRVSESQKLMRFPQLFAYVNGVGKLEADADKKTQLSNGQSVDLTFEIHVRNRFQQLANDKYLLPAQAIVDIRSAYKTLGREAPDLLAGAPSEIEPSADSALYRNIKLFIRAYLEMAEVHRLSDHYFYGFVFGSISGRKEVEARLLDRDIFYNAQYRRLRLATQTMEQGPTRQLYDHLASLNFSLTGTTDTEEDARGVIESTRWRSGDEINLPGLDLKGKLVQYDVIRSDDDGSFNARMEAYKRQNGGKLPTVTSLRARRVCASDDTDPCKFVDITQEKTIQVTDGSLLIRTDFDKKRTVVMRVFDPSTAQYVGSALASASLAFGRLGGNLANASGGAGRTINDAIREQRTALRGDAADLLPGLTGDQTDFGAFTQATNKIPLVSSWFDLLLGEKFRDVSEALKSVVSFGSLLDADVHKSLSRGFLALESVAYTIDLALRAASVFGGFVGSYLTPVNGYFYKLTSHLYKAWDWLITSSIIRYIDFKKSEFTNKLRKLWERVKKWVDIRKKDDKPLLETAIPRDVLQQSRRQLTTQVAASNTTVPGVDDDDIDDDDKPVTWGEFAALLFKTAFGYSLSFIKIVGDMCLQLVAYDVSNFSATPLRSLLRIGVRTATILMLGVALPSVLLNLGTFTKAFVVSTMTQSAALALSAVLAEIVQYAAERVVGPYNDPTVRSKRTDIIKKAIFVLGSFGVTQLPFGVTDVVSSLALFDTTGGVFARIGDPFRFPAAIVVSDQISDVVKSAETAEMVMFAGRAAAQLFTPMIFNLLGRTSATLDAESMTEQSRKVAEAFTQNFITEIRRRYDNDRFMETTGVEFRTQRRVYELMIKYSLTLKSGEVVPVASPQLSLVGANILAYISSPARPLKVVMQTEAERRVLSKTATLNTIALAAASLVQVGSVQRNRPTVFRPTIEAALEGVDTGAILFEMIAAYQKIGESDPYTPQAVIDDSKLKPVVDDEEEDDEKEE